MRSQRWDSLLEAALVEDIGAGDITTEALVASRETRAVAQMVARQGGVVAGLPLAARVMQLLDEECTCSFHHEEGSRIEPGALLATFRGPAQALLTGERVALNLVQRLSGIATRTRQAVDAVSPWPCKVLDTRKTTLSMRSLERYAVRMGGGSNHRFNLNQAAMIKDNHRLFFTDLPQALQRIRDRGGPLLPIVIEVETLAQVEEALAAGAQFLLLDNFPIPLLRQAVARAQGRAFLEASGGITLASVAEVASTGVQAVSMGCLTHSVAALDIGLDFTEETEA